MNSCVRPPSSPVPIGLKNLIHELMRFPVGKHDDQVDVLSLIGRMLSDMGTASDWSKPMPYMDVAVV